MSRIVCRWHIRKNNIDEPIDGYDANQDFRAAHRTHQTIALSTSQQMHQPYQMKHNTNNNGNQAKRIFVLASGTLSLNDIKRSDAGVYICVASNTEGSETLEIQLSVIEALTVQILPTQQTVDLGKSSDLVSKWTPSIECIVYKVESFYDEKCNELCFIALHCDRLSACECTVVEGWSTTKNRVACTAANEGAHQNNFSYKRGPRHVSMFRSEWLRRGAEYGRDAIRRWDAFYFSLSFPFKWFEHNNCMA